MNNTSVEEMYRKHHEARRGAGFVLLGEERGAFLRRHIGQGKQVLDIGCRDGALTSSYAKGNKVLGVDIDSEALLRAKEQVGIETMHLDLLGNWNELGERDFDVVVACEILEHLYYPDKIVAKVREVLRQDGIFLGTVPNAFSLKNRIRLFFARKKNTPLADPTHINHFSRDELIGLLRKSFTDVQVEPLGRYKSLDCFWPGMFSFGLMFVAKGPRDINSTSR